MLELFKNNYVKQAKELPFFQLAREFSMLFRKKVILCVVCLESSLVFYSLLVLLPAAYCLLHLNLGEISPSEKTR